ncbi:hypothetical protein DACRYDRAFT_107441 [Dacryopinax primogenitus]|uniref:Uncharacterized protein n=1 Tax=Dacryopinax primogenitus (strain DJM 731) TaxID=1858805 RepID=M5G0Q9_DACPD|nr:uncharacterized protein DACRYDRAFT_107441 [Dacryopinax primogenitus]EJU01695.1 hypothetical protein DACRYDRAFT_107441 [Dacryopinax primogenitus]
MCIARIAKAAALPPVPAKELFHLETPEPEPIEETTKKPANKKKQKAVCSYVPANPKKCEQEDDEDLPGPSTKWSRLPEAKIELPVAPLQMAEHKMLELWKSLQTAQKVVNTATGWADQVQTLLGRALTE